MTDVGEYPFVNLYDRKNYLMFLDTARVDSALLAGYNLVGKHLLSPVFCGDGVYELNTQYGISRLRQTEQYLGLSPMPVEIIPLSSWIDSLRAAVAQAVGDGEIKDPAFGTTLEGMLANARDLLMQGDSTSCANGILRFSNMVDGASSGFDRIRSVETDLDLSMDALYLRSHLPEVAEGNIPHVESISPSSMQAGGPAFTVTIIGEDFENGAQVYWNWSPRTTTFVSPTQVQAIITSEDIGRGDTATISVVNPNGATHGSTFVVLANFPSRLEVKLINSHAAGLTGGALQYYEGSWKDAVNNGDGTFTVNTNQNTVSLRMTYAYGSQQKNNVPVNGGPVTFQTVNTQVKLQNSQGGAIDTGTVQYYAGAWRSFGATSNGTASMELLPANYSFRMTYAGGSNDKQQDVGTNSTVVFQTVNAAVQLQNSQGDLMDQGTVQYYAGAWRDFGSTTNGVVTKELLPNTYSFRMIYAYASKDKQQNIGSNPTVVFNTVNATVDLRNSLASLIDQGTVQYYAGAWRSFGTTSNGSVSKELLSNSYSFRMMHEYVSNDKQQDIGTNSTVSFSTVLCTIKVTNALGQTVDGAQISYYSGAWRVIGTTVSGQITKELLPANLSFRMSYAGKTQDKQQNLATNPVVEFSIQ